MNYAAPDRTLRFGNGNTHMIAARNMKPDLRIVQTALVLLAALVAGIPSAIAQGATFRFSSAAYSVTESGGAAKITVKRSGNNSETVSVSFMTIDSGGGRAMPDEDYYPTNGTLTFGPGVGSQVFYVPIVDDVLHEDDEAIFVELGDLSSARVTIKDNDDCEFSVASKSLTFDADGGLTLPVPVTATAGCSWTAAKTTESAGWLGIFSSSSGNGDGEIVFSLDPNPEPGSRTAKLMIAGIIVTVTQLPVPLPDLIPPTVSISSPKAGSRQTSETITVTGKASDNVAVTLVEARLENDAYISDYVPATGTANWTVNLYGLIPGTNIIRVRAWDAENEPTESTREVFFVAFRPITLVANGTGSIKPLSDGQLLDVGTSYTVKAKAAKRHFFVGWTGSIESEDESLTFVMSPGILLQANFVPSPFSIVAGNYNGLFVESEAIRNDSTGFLSIKVTDLGAYSAKMTLGGKRSSFSGKFALDGKVTNTVSRAGASSVTVILSLDFSGTTDQLTGTISDGEWTASVLCDRPLFNKSTNPAPQAGRYTVIMPGNVLNAELEPGGYSYGTVTVDAGGGVKLKAVLADGTKVTQKTSLSKSGWWPLHVPLYRGNGSILSWVIFAESSEADFTGVVNWVKPSQAGDDFYPAGFAVQHELSGVRFERPADKTLSVLNFSSGRVEFTAGNLAEDFSNDVTLLKNKVGNLSDNSLKLSIKTSSGLFSGTVVVPGTTEKIKFRGVLHQKQNHGWGFFLGTNASGRVRFSQ